MNSTSTTSPNFINLSPEAKRFKRSPLDPSKVHTVSSTARVENHMAHIISVIQTMKHQESTAYRTSPYLHNAAVTEEDRQEMCNWGFGIVDACQLDRHVATVAISYFDRFLSCRGLRSVEICLAGQREFQLAFITCLIIALKARESMKVTPNFVAETMCDDMYHPEEFVAMEIEILRTLGWRLNGPAPQDFIQHFVELFPPCTDDKVVDMITKEASKNAERAMMDYSMAMEPYSCVALASIAATVRNLGSQMGCDLSTVNQWMGTVGFVMRKTSVPIE